MTTEHLIRQTTRAGTDILTEHPHGCPKCQRETYWFRNRLGRSRCIRCANHETADHDPADCDVEACETCASFWRDEAVDRQYDDWREER